ncbi:uncharacterized protein LOC121422902 [Lytechinus variegatus]|uniref:uncharacterized protein LOC121422902 n=1 Tax=Lytechinus variegatus TaxID=7654 RepID=UPI001BB1D400|nr:uncharacterized protein LOC121422902 [Lytechinus variegatus]
MLQQEDFDLHTLSMEDDRPVHDSMHPSLSPRDEEFPTSCETSTKKSPTDGKSEKSHEVQNKESTTLSWLFGRLWSFSRRKPHIYLCTSMDPSTISGLKEHLKPKCDPCRSILQEQELPHGGLDEFRLPPEASRRDAVILCHSVQNRGLAITDVENSIYEEFLKHCNAVFGKGHVCVIVHDFEFNSGALKGSRAILQTRQPMTFKMAGLIILAGKLADGELQISKEEIEQLKNFITGIR